MELTRNYWEEYTPYYEFLKQVSPYKELLARVWKEGGISDTDHVLDAGAGIGNLELVARENGSLARVTGIDYSVNALKLYKERIPDSEVIEADLTKRLPFPDDFFDAVIANNTLHTISPEKREGVIKEFYRILKPGGRVVVADAIKTFNPFSVYRKHVRDEFRAKGFLKTGAWMLKLLIPTLQIFRYADDLNRANEDGGAFYCDEKEHQTLLTAGGFQSVSMPVRVYADQVILHSAVKL